MSSNWRLRNRRQLFDSPGVGFLFPGGAAFEDVENINLLACQAAGFEDFIEELPRAAYEGHSLLVLLSTRGLSEETQPGIGIADPKHRLCSGSCEFFA